MVATRSEGDKNVYRKVATDMDARYGASGVHVFYSIKVYEPANHAMEEKLVAQGYPRATIWHPRYFHHDSWITMIVRAQSHSPTAVGIPVGEDGKPHPTADSRRTYRWRSRRPVCDWQTSFRHEGRLSVKQIQTFIPEKLLRRFFEKKIDEKDL